MSSVPVPIPSPPQAVQTPSPRTRPVSVPSTPPPPALKAATLPLSLPAFQAMFSESWATTFTDDQTSTDVRRRAFHAEDANLQYIATKSALYGQATTAAGPILNDKVKAHRHRTLRERLQAAGEWQTVRDDAEQLVRKREELGRLYAAASGRRYNARDDVPLKTLREVLLLNERQKLAQLRDTINRLDLDSVLSSIDLKDVQDEEARKELQAALLELETAFWKLRVAWSSAGAARLHEVKEIVGKARPETDNDGEFFIRPLPEPELRPNSSKKFWKLVTGETDAVTPGRRRRAEDRLTEFGGIPPTRAELAALLGFRYVSEVDMLLCQGPVFHAFNEYMQARPERPGSVDSIDGSRLGQLEALMTATKGQLREGARPGSPHHGGFLDLDFHAALFAHQVLRFIEGSGCTLVAWDSVVTKLGTNEASLDLFKTAERRWAIVLKILWYLEMQSRGKSASKSTAKKADVAWSG
ncbi:hypothetical protein F5Y15DRAFT_418057 [Xylariaceae sp. FL0016]|nr:hypothetical protein F5Y15DRAFT_418057 [Xylariaceae sp. FL0016]